MSQYQNIFLAQNLYIGIILLHQNYIKKYLKHFLSMYYEIYTAFYGFLNRIPLNYFLPIKI